MRFAKISCRVQSFFLDISKLSFSNVIKKYLFVFYEKYCIKKQEVGVMSFVARVLSNNV